LPVCAARRRCEDRLPEIDGLRFIAIASVLLYHMQGQLSHHYQLVILPSFTCYVLPHLAASVGYMHYLIFQAPSAINSVAWSLEIEVQFYILAPLLSMVFAIRNGDLRGHQTRLDLLAQRGAPVDPRDRLDLRESHSLMCWQLPV
jgi:peptidoglycan/LPS O-acetylase OafA/YrhL